jgi:hypothetical protein
MGVTCHLTPNRAQTKALRGVIACGFHPAIIQNYRLRAFSFQKKLAIIGAMGGFSQQIKGACRVEMRVKRAERGICHLKVLDLDQSASL